MMNLLLVLAVAANPDPRVAVLRQLSDDQLCASLNRSAPKAVAEHNGPAQINQIRPDCASKKVRIFTQVPVAPDKSDAYVREVSVAAQNQICARKTAVTEEFLRRGWSYEYHITFADGSTKVLPVHC
jgi:hypothetical protein